MRIPWSLTNYRSTHPVAQWASVVYRRGGCSVWMRIYYPPTEKPLCYLGKTENIWGNSVWLWNHSTGIDEIVHPRQRDFTKHYTRFSNQAKKRSSKYEKEIGLR